MRRLNLSGQIFGRLSVVGQAAPHADGALWWTCRCECGVTKEARSSDLKRGFIQSCGCIRRELPKKRVTHGGATKGNPSRLYRIWQAMRDRTGNPRASRYAYYGGRGISVCHEWHDFATFRDWALAHGYADNLSIDRINNDGNYEPANCRWATQKEQCSNRRQWGAVTRKGKNMKNFVAHAAQGEIYIQKIEAAPKGLAPVAIEKGVFVVAHSESGNSHVIDAGDGVILLEKPDAPEGMRLLYALLEKPATLYQNAASPHEGILLEPGIYALRIAREFDPFNEQVRRVAD